MKALQCLYPILKSGHTYSSSYVIITGFDPVDLNYKKHVLAFHHTEVIYHAALKHLRLMMLYYVLVLI